MISGSSETKASDKQNLNLSLFRGSENLTNCKNNKTLIKIENGFFFLPVQKDFHLHESESSMFVHASWHKPFFCLVTTGG
jgi:hypothetical protein